MIAQPCTEQKNDQVGCFQYGFFTNQTIHFAIFTAFGLPVGGDVPVSFLLGGFWLGVAIKVYFVQFLVSEKFPHSGGVLTDINLGRDSLQPFPQLSHSRRLEKHTIFF